MREHECPYCGAELEQTDSYGNKEYIIYDNQKGKQGDIFSCPNRDGFSSEEEAKKYAEENSIEYSSWEEICCESNSHNVSGSFYTDKDGNLHNGYPC